MHLFLTGFVVGLLFTWMYYLFRYQSLRQRVQAITKSLEEDAKRAIEKERQQAEVRAKESLAQIAKEQAALLRKEAELKDLATTLEQQKREGSKLALQKKNLTRKEEELASCIQAWQQKLEEVSSLSFSQIKASLIEKAEKEAVFHIQNRTAALDLIHEKECSRRAHELLFSAMERKTQCLTKDIFLTQVSLENPHIVPSFIGKEGRNIHTLEELLHVKLIIDETRVLISSHDSRQRYLAKLVIESLLKQDKISFARITSVHDHVIQNVDAFLCSEGMRALQTIDPTATFPPEVYTALGNLTLRSSAGQNVLKHSIEVAELMGILAAELQLRPKIAQLMGLFHDVGKSLPTKYGPTHASAGKTFLHQHNVNEEIVNAVASHHGETVATSEEARLLPICDRISAQLPGIRNPTEPAFLPMVRQCEEIAQQHSPILSAWAHYAGSHIELIVRHNGCENERSLRHTLEANLGSFPLPIHITMLDAYQQQKAHHHETTR